MHARVEGRPFERNQKTCRRGQRRSAAEAGAWEEGTGSWRRCSAAAAAGRSLRWTCLPGRGTRCPEIAPRPSLPGSSSTAGRHYDRILQHVTTTEIYLPTQPIYVCKTTDKNTVDALYLELDGAHQLKKAIDVHVVKRWIAFSSAGSSK